MDLTPVYINVGFIPDMVFWQAYKFGLCELCKIEKEIKKDFDNKNCIHCKKLDRICQGAFTPIE